MIRPNFYNRKERAMTNIPNDPIMLLSYLNTKLRDDYSSLDALCDDLNLSKENLINKLSLVDYHYDETTNRFC